MAQLAFGAGGAALGSMVGQPGLGFAVGSLLYSVVGGSSEEDVVSEGPRVDKAIGTTSAFGVMRPIIYGTFPVQGNIIDSSKKREIKHEEEQDSGGKGMLSGPTSTVVYYTAQIDVAIGLGEGPRDGLVRLYAGQVTILEILNGSVKTNISGLKYKIYPGNSTQLPDPTLQRIHGVGETPAYRDEAYVVLTDFDLEPFGNNIPPFRAISTSKATVGNSTIEYDFGLLGSISGLWQDRRKSFAYHQGNAQALDKMVDVYDCITRQKLFSMPWSSDFVRIDEGGGSGLFSVPAIIEAETIARGPNANFFVNVEVDAGFGGIAVWDAGTGAYVGTLDLLIPLASNVPGWSVSDHNGRYYRATLSATGINRLTSWSIFEGIGGLTFTENGYVNIPFVREAGEASWHWALFRESSNRQGTFAVTGKDNLTGLNYIVIVNEGSIYPEAYDEVAGLTGDPTSIIYDSVQDLYWLIGQSSTSSSITRLIAYDSSADIVYNTEISGTMYSFVPLASFSPEKGGIMWNSTSGIMFFDTSTQEVHNLGQGAGGGGVHDQAFYNADTNSYWCTENGHFLQVTSLERLSIDQLMLDVPVIDICKRAGLSPSQYVATDLAATPIDGFGLITDQQFRSALRVLQEAYVFDGLDKGDFIEFRLRGKDPVATIPRSDLGAFPAKDGSTSDLPLIEIDNRMDLELPGRTEITYYSAALEYEQQTQVGHRWASAVEENKASITLPVVLTDDYGAKLADVKEHLSHIARVLYRVKVLPKWRYLCPGDVVVIDVTDTEQYTGQIIRKSFNRGVVELILNRDDKSVFESFRGAQTPQGRTEGVDNNPLTFSQFIDGPLFFNSHNNPGFPVANSGFSDGWKGGNIYRSSDLGASFQLLGTFFREAVMGNTIGALADRKSTTLDQVSTLSVEIRGAGSIPSAPIEEVLKGANHVVVGKNGRWEVIGVVNSTLQPDGTFLIEPPMLRGRLGTEQLTGTHVNGDSVILLEGNKLNYIADSLQNLNVDKLMRSASIGANLFSGQVADQSFRNTAECLKPLAPAQFKVVKNPALDLYFSWGPRTRFRFTDFWTALQSDAPLFTLIITNVVSGLVIRTITDTTDAFYNYTRVDQELDGLPADDNVLLDVTVQHKTVSLPEGSNLGSASYLQALSGPPVPPMIDYAANVLGMSALWEFSDDLTNPVVQGTPMKESTGKYEAHVNNASNLFTFGEPPLLPGYKTCVKIDNYGQMVAPFMAVEDFRLTDFSVSVLFQAQETKTGTRTEILQIGVNKLQIVWESGGELIMRQNSPLGENTILSGIIPVVGKTYLLTVTYQSPTPQTLRDITFYINDTKVGTVSARWSNNDDTLEVRFVMGYSPQVFSAYRNQIMMAYNRKISDAEAANLFAFTGLPA